MRQPHYPLRSSGRSFVMRIPYKVHSPESVRSSWRRRWGSAGSDLISRRSDLASTPLNRIWLCTEPEGGKWVRLKEIYFCGPDPPAETNELSRSIPPHRPPRPSAPSPPSSLLSPQRMQAVAAPLVFYPFLLPKPPRRSPDAAAFRCVSCSSTETSVMRCGPLGPKTLCNKCASSTVLS